MEKDCCEKWTIGIEEINGFITFGINHMILYKSGVFKFCPWCGKERQLDEKTNG